MTANLWSIVGPGDNQATSESTQAAYALASSTFSTRMTNSQTFAFLRRFNRFLQADTRALLRKYPPDQGTLIAILDCHDEKYWVKRPPKPRTAVALTRYYYRHHNHSEHKPSSHVNRWLYVCLSWEHAGQILTTPVLMWLLLPTQMLPRQHIQLARHAMREVKAEGELLLGDRYYDATDVQKEADESSISVGVRLRFPEAGRRRPAWTADGCPVDLMIELERTARMPLPVQTRTFWPDSSTVDEPRRVAFRARKIKVRLRQDGPVKSVILEAGLKPMKRNGKPAWAFDRGMSMMLAMPANVTTSQGRKFYQWRWRIEDLARDLTTDRPDARPKNVASYVAQHCGYTYLALWGLRLRFRLRQAGQPKKVEGLPVKRLTIRTLLRLIRAQVPTLPEPPPPA